MAKALRWLVVVLAGIVLSALLEPWLVAALDSLGWYKGPGSSVNRISQLVGEAAFPWIAGATFGVAAGVLLDWMARRFDGSRADHVMEVGAGQLGGIVEQLRRYIGFVEDREAIDARPTINRLITLRADLAAVRVTLRQLKIDPPLMMDVEADPVLFIHHNLRVLEELAALLAQGHLKQARLLATSMHKRG